MKINELLESVHRREEDCWRMANTFLENRDAHGVMDMGAELQALQRSITELKKLD